MRPEAEPGNVGTPVRSAPGAAPEESSNCCAAQSEGQAIVNASKGNRSCAVPAQGLVRGGTTQK
jgi:hypothetical protein